MNVIWFHFHQSKKNKRICEMIHFTGASSTSKSCTKNNITILFIKREDSHFVVYLFFFFYISQFSDLVVRVSCCILLIFVNSFQGEWKMNLFKFGISFFFLYLKGLVDQWTNPLSHFRTFFIQRFQLLISN